MRPPTDPAMSRSAVWLAGVIAMTGKHPRFRSVFHDPLAEPLFRATAYDPDSILGPATDPGWIARYVREFEASLPGFISHVPARKRWILDRATAYLPTIRSVLILGSGLDGLGCRLASSRYRPLVREVDKAVVMTAKKAILADTAVDFVATDLATPVEEWLPNLTENLPTPVLVIAEGVLEYLPQSVSTALLAALSTSGDCQVIGSQMDPRALELPHFKAVLRRRDPRDGERFKTLWHTEETGERLGERGLALTDLMKPKDMREVFLPSIGIDADIYPPIRPLDGMSFWTARPMGNRRSGDRS